MKTILGTLFLASAAWADEVHLEDGRVIEGKVEELADQVKVSRQGGSVTFPRFIVRKIEYKETPEELYRQKARRIEDGDLEGHLQLARWCLEKKLAPEARLEFDQVIALDPDHEEARAGLGHTFFQGQWMTRDRYHEARGLVRHKVRWMTPEQRDLEAALEEQRELDARLAREVKTLLDRTHHSDEPKRREARERLSGIDDKYKVKDYLAAISSAHRPTRAFVFREIARMKEPAAAKPLARRAIWDEDLRLEAFRALMAIRHPDTALFLAPYLEEESTSARIRTAEAIGAFQDLRVVPALLAALENAMDTSRTLERYGSEMTAVVHSTVLLRSGQKIILPRIVRIKPEAFDREQVKRLESEQAALESALRAITRQDFGKDLARWRAWFSKQSQ